MSSKKFVKKFNTKKNPTKKSTEKNFVVKFHTSLDGENNSWGSPMFYSESGQGWVNYIGGATRYSEGGADKLMLELLQNDKIATELVDLSQKPENLFAHNTVLLGPSNIPYIITKVPQFAGDSYVLTYHSINSDFNSGFKSEDWSEEDLLDMLREDKFSALWDSNIGIVPENNMEFTSTLGYELR